MEATCVVEVRCQVAVGVEAVAAVGVVDCDCTANMLLVTAVTTRLRVTMMSPNIIVHQSTMIAVDSNHADDNEMTCPTISPCPSLSPRLDVGTASTFPRFRWAADPRRAEGRSKQHKQLANAVACAG